VDGIGASIGGMVDAAMHVGVVVQSLVYCPTREGIVAEDE